MSNSGQNDMIAFYGACEFQERFFAKNVHRRALALMVINNFGDCTTLFQMAKWAECEAWTLNRWFIARLGTTPMRWLWGLRYDVASELLETFPGTSITTVAVACGFASPAHFSRGFRRRYEMSPADYQEKYAITESKMLQENSDIQLAALASAARRILLNRIFLVTEDDIAAIVNAYQ
jgi:AraC-like DNA-binding protein